MFSPVPVAAWIVLSIIFAVSGPFGTYEQLTIGLRAVFWFSMIGVWMSVGVATRVVVQHLAPRMSYLAASSLSAVLVGLVAAVVGPSSVRPLVTISGHLAPGPIEIVVMVAAIGIGVALLRIQLTPSEGAAPADSAPVARLLQRLPDAVRGEILHLCAGDHYVEVVTDRGRHKVLMRFSDAIEEVGPVEGFRVHRSHWVARAAVAEARRAGGRVMLLLINGTEVPVSRAYEEVVASLGPF